MASKRAQRRRACDGKVQYPDMRAAIYQAWKARQRGEGVVVAYPCPFSRRKDGTVGHFHIGHQPASIRHAIAERRAA